MKLLRLLFMAVCLAAFSAFAALAQDRRGAEPAEPAGRVEIVPDQDAGAVRILIDGREVATIDADGLHVAGNITYTGKLRDTGGDAE